MSDILIRTACRPIQSGQALRVAVTGGIGVGKSTVSQMLEKLGAIRIDADQIAHQVLEEKTKEIADAFGYEEWKNGINRKELAKIVFRDKKARIKLEQIVHPTVKEKAQKQLAELKSGQIGIYDVPLLGKNKNATKDTDYHIVVVVTAPLEQRYRRLADRSEMTRAEVNQRIDAQKSDKERIKNADIIIENTGSKEELEQLVKNKLWPLLIVAATGESRN